MDMQTHPTHTSYTILGSTGSVGTATLDLLRHTGVEPGQIEALVAHSNVEALIAQAREFQPKSVVLADEAGYPLLKTALAGLDIEVSAGDSAVLEAAQRPSDWVMAAIVGVAGLLPVLTAAKRGATIALANKESLVCAGQTLMTAAKRAGATILPVDSEHSAIYQVLEPENASQVDHITLTASGGPFRQSSLAEMAQVTARQACDHPNWSMGAKISVDSATMMNKGLELIEAALLFHMPEQNIDVLVHPESIVHSMVTYTDGSSLAQLSPPDMRTPIAYALGWPKRIAWPAPRLDLATLQSLTFERHDPRRFPLLDMARAALRLGGGMPCVLNAANEVGVEAFLMGKIGFLDIARVVAEVIEHALAHDASSAVQSAHDIEDILMLDKKARRWAVSVVAALGTRVSHTPKHVEEV